MTNLREKTRRAVQNSVAETALHLFEEQGYEETTIEQIAIEAGLSKRSFFRYFASKEDVVTCAFEAFGEKLGDLILARPRGEDAWTSMISAFKEFTDFITPDQHVARLKLTRTTPSLRAALAGIARTWRTIAWRALQTRDSSLSRLEADVIAASTHGVWLAAIDEWLPQHDQTDIDDVVDAAFKFLLDQRAAPRKRASA